LSLLVRAAAGAAKEVAKGIDLGKVTSLGKSVDVKDVDMGKIAGEVGKIAEQAGKELMRVATIVGDIIEREVGHDEASPAPPASPPEGPKPTDVAPSEPPPDRKE
jgi:hypothetical protein